MNFRTFYFVLALFVFMMRVSQFLWVSCKGCWWPIKGAILENLHMPSMNKHHCNASHHIWRAFANKTVAWHKSIAYACKWIASRSVTRSISGQTFSAVSRSKHTRFSDDKSKFNLENLKEMVCKSLFSFITKTESVLKTKHSSRLPSFLPGVVSKKQTKHSHIDNIQKD